MEIKSDCKKDKTKHIVYLKGMLPLPQKFLVLEGFKSRMIKQVEIRREWKDCVVSLYCSCDRMAQ